jgi:MoxR-like ATPase
MENKLSFLTKELVEKAVEAIEKNGVPKNREGSLYHVEIGGRFYPFKLLVTEAAKIAEVSLTHIDFQSNQNYRNIFEELTDFECVDKDENEEYFQLDQFPIYKNEVGKKYESGSNGAAFYKNTREKLQYLGYRLGKELNVELKNNYNEKPNKMAGQGMGFVLKEYILTGFVPARFDVGKSIFIKLNFHIYEDNFYFGLDVDINFSDSGNPYNSKRDDILEATQWSIPLDETFPSNWYDLINLVKPKFKDCINYVESFLQNKKKSMALMKYIDILHYKKQIILQGPPGTGKTYTAKDLAELMIFDSVSQDKKIQKQRLEANEQFKLVQFHPSYSYEDFVRGITAKTEEGNVVYETKNKILGEFAEKAQNNFLASEKDLAEFSKEQKVEQLILEFAEKVQDEIDEKEAFPITKSVSVTHVEQDAFRYAGDWKVSQRMKFKDLVKALLHGASSRKEIKEVPGISGLAIQHATYFFRMLSLFKKRYEAELKKVEGTIVSKPALLNYLLIIDEINRANLPSVLGELIYALEYRGENISSMYGLDDDNNNTITIPENLYIIGTMNTADRSVGHIDYAIRRRFAFIDVLPNIEVVKHPKAKELFAKVSELFLTSTGENSEYIAPDFDPKDVQIGHSYFIVKDDKELELRLKYEILPILREYVKDGILLDLAKEELQKLEKFAI